MSKVTKIALVGAGGRMGREIIAVTKGDPCAEVAVAIVSTEAEAAELNHPNVLVAGAAADAAAECDVIIDFSSPGGFAAALATAHASGTSFVSGTTGLTPQHFAAIDAAAGDVGVLWAANFSVGVNVLEHLVELGARALEGFDIEVFEAHHRHKVDAPSGTALHLARAAARGRDVNLDDVAEWSRHGQTGGRTDAEIGFQVVRGGSIVGEHTVFLCGTGERVELTHRAQERAIFARGAVRAAKWIASRGAGRYTMKDVLFG